MFWTLQKLQGWKRGILEFFCHDAVRRAGTMVGLEIPLRSWCELAEWWLIVVVRKVREMMDYGSEGP